MISLPDRIGTAARVDYPLDPKTIAVYRFRDGEVLKASVTVEPHFNAHIQGDQYQVYVRLHAHGEQFTLDAWIENALTIQSRLVESVVKVLTRYQAGLNKALRDLPTPEIVESTNPTLWDRLDDS
jgi:hypothetical protein